MKNLKNSKATRKFKFLDNRILKNKMFKLFKIRNYTERYRRKQKSKAPISTTQTRRPKDPI